LSENRAAISPREKALLALALAMEKRGRKKGTEKRGQIYFSFKGRTNVW
jgi:hypothetical protein